jgi:uncharacterized protein YbjT (DUF2867 family)
MIGIYTAAHGQSAVRVLVLGGRGFIGRHAVAALVAAGANVSVGSRRAALPDVVAAHNVPANPPIVQLRMETLLDAQAWMGLLAGFDAVLNCVGILRQRGRETYQRVHCDAPAALAAACKARQIRLVHVSALGLAPQRDGQAVLHRSRFLRSKLAGEQLLQASGASMALVRPSLLDGADGFGASWLRRFAGFPVHVVPANALGKIAPLAVQELGVALAQLCLDPQKTAPECPVYELGGPQALSLAQYLAQLRVNAGHARAARVIRVPGFLVRLGAHLCDVLHFSPLSFGHYELLQYDNCPSDALLRNIGSNDLPIASKTPQDSTHVHL